MALSPVPVAFAVGVTALALFVVLERRRQRRGEPGMLDLALFAIPSFRNGNIAAAIVSLGEFGIIFALPLWLQNVIGYTAFETGLVLLALAGGSFAASGISAPRWARRAARCSIVRAGHRRWRSSASRRSACACGPTRPGRWSCRCSSSTASASAWRPRSSPAWCWSTCPCSAAAKARALQDDPRQIGSALGIAILGTVLFLTARRPVRQRPDDLGVPEARASSSSTRSVDSAGAAIPGLATEPGHCLRRPGARAAYTDATRSRPSSRPASSSSGWPRALSLGRGRRPHDETEPVPLTTSEERA